MESPDEPHEYASFGFLANQDSHECTKTYCFSFENILKKLADSQLDEVQHVALKKFILLKTIVHLQKVRNFGPN